MSTAAIPYAPPTTQGWYYDATHKVLWVQFGPLASTASTMVSIQ